MWSGKKKSWICYEDLVLAGRLFCSEFDPKWNLLRIVDNEGFIVSVDFTGLHSQRKSNNIRSCWHKLALFALPSKPGSRDPWIVMPGFQLTGLEICYVITLGLAIQTSNWTAGKRTVHVHCFQSFCIHGAFELPRFTSYPLKVTSVKQVSPEILSYN